MIGSAFITHNNTWSCSNEVSMSKYSVPNIQDGKVISTKQFDIISIKGIFNHSESLKVGDKCEIVLKADDADLKYSFIGEVMQSGEIQIIINNLIKTDKVSEILSNITLKN